MNADGHGWEARGAARGIGWWGVRIRGMRVVADRVGAPTAFDFVAALMFWSAAPLAAHVAFASQTAFTFARGKLGMMATIVCTGLVMDEAGLALGLWPARKRWTWGVIAGCALIWAATVLAWPVGFGVRVGMVDAGVVDWVSEK